jgi:DTW domain-containing protein YfiP
MRCAWHVVVLAHPDESKRAFSSVRLLPRLLENSDTIVGRRFRVGDHPVLDQALDRRDTLLLYPGPESFELAPPRAGIGATGECATALAAHIDDKWLRHEVMRQAATCFRETDDVAESEDPRRRKRDRSRRQRQIFNKLLIEAQQGLARGKAEGQSADVPSDRGQQERCLIVLDGTWKEASRLLHQNDRLREWPLRVCLHVPRASKAAPDFEPEPELSGDGEFMCRPPPQQGLLSTLEAIGRALMALHSGAGVCVGGGDGGAAEVRFGESEYDLLLRPMRLMVEQQYHYAYGHTAQHRRSNAHAYGV